MKIAVVRQEHKPWGVDGKLYINRIPVCDTVEHPHIHLPPGEYTLTNDRSLLNKDMCTILSPFRHGDGALASTHCEIIVGKTALPGVVTQSQATYDRLYDRLKKTFRRGTPVILTITG